MWRTVLSVLGGLVAWGFIVTLLNFGLRLWLPGYVEAEPAMAFTLPMKIGRLLMSAVSCVAAGAVVRVIAPSSRFAPWIAGLTLMVMFLPVHVQLWPRFPVWYHLTFLLPLAPLFALGGSIRAAAPGTRPAA